MFNVTCKIRKMIDAGLNIAIGTDSTHTGSVNLFHEMRYARHVYKSMYGEDLPAKKIVEMVTINPARAFRMEDRTGSIEAGKYADILLLKPQHADPYEALLQAEPKDIQLLLQEGKPLMGDPAFKQLFQGNGSEYSEIVLQGKPKLVKGDPEGLLKRVRKNVGFKKELDFIPIDVQNV
jgi:cytosine/adenosine deaminase-related metal-dependent hydrolase